MCVHPTVSHRLINLSLSPSVPAGDHALPGVGVGSEGEEGGGMVGGGPQRVRRSWRLHVPRWLSSNTRVHPACLLGDCDVTRPVQPGPDVLSSFSLSPMSPSSISFLSLLFQFSFLVSLYLFSVFSVYVLLLPSSPLSAALPLNLTLISCNTFLFNPSMFFFFFFSLADLILYLLHCLSIQSCSVLLICFCLSCPVCCSTTTYPC